MGLEAKVLVVVTLTLELKEEVLVMVTPVESEAPSYSGTKAS